MKTLVLAVRTIIGTITFGAVVYGGWMILYIFAK